MYIAENHYNFVQGTVVKIKAYYMICKTSFANINILTDMENQRPSMRIESVVVNICTELEVKNGVYNDITSEY